MSPETTQTMPTEKPFDEDNLAEVLAGFRIPQAEGRLAR